MKNFDLQKGGIVYFQKCKVDEFNTLNSELSRLTDKVSRDFKNLREFTENMSHETQTPLAIIRSKLELLLQKANDEEQVQQVLSTLDSVNRLSKMNKGLILLTRIENDQYAGRKMLSLGAMLRKQLDDLELFISSRSIKVHTQIDDSINIKMNPHLAEILFNNLLSNAIRYNITGGDLYVTLSAEGITIANSGDPLTIPGKEVFERFRKGDSPDSIGLGLAIVKKIIDHDQFVINYDYIDNHHTFTIHFQKTDSLEEEIEA